MDEEILPKSRSAWAALNWKDAQHNVAKLLKQNGYTIIEEKSFDNHKRSDVFVFRQLSGQTIFGIVEVKCYQKINRAIEDKAMIQAIGYFNALYRLVSDNPRWGSTEKKYFCAVIFTKDYPALDNHHIAQYKEYLPDDPYQEGQPILISTSANSLIDRLNVHFPPFLKQTTLDDYW